MTASNEVQCLKDRLSEFNCAATSITDGDWLAILARDEADRIAAAISGNTYGGCLENRPVLVEEGGVGRGRGRCCLAQQSKRLVDGAAST
jgi:hypothetical protein